MFQPNAVPSKSRRFARVRRTFDQVVARRRYIPTSPKDRETPEGRIIYLPAANPYSGIAVNFINTYLADRNPAAWFFGSDDSLTMDAHRAILAFRQMPACAQQLVIEAIATRKGA